MNCGHVVWKFFSCIQSRMVKKTGGVNITASLQNNTNLEELVRRKRMFFKNQKQSLPSLKKQVADLKNEHSTMISRALIRKKKDVERKILLLETQIKSIESDEESKKYEQQILPYMQAHQWYRHSYNLPIQQKPSTPFHSRAKNIQPNQRKLELVNEYLIEVEKAAPSIIFNSSSDTCEICNVSMILSLNGSVIKCPVCNNAHPYLDATSASVAYNDDVEFASFTYKKSNHFQEWLNKFQYKESTQVPDDVIAKVMDYFFTRSIELRRIDQAMIRQALKHYLLRKHYDHTAQIHCRITGIPPVRMTPEQENKCKLMFQAIQEPFLKWRPKIAPERVNFLSYSYCLFKFCQLLGYTEFLSCFTLLKGKDKLNKQDALFEAICKELDWEFIPSAIDTTTMQKIKLLQR